MSELTTPVRGDVPIDMHPDSVIGHARVLDQENTVGVSVLSAAREALTTAYDAYAKLNEAEQAIRALETKPYRRQTADGRSQARGNLRMVNGTPTQVAASDELIDAASKAFERVSVAIDRRVIELNRGEKALRTRVDAAIEDPARKTPEGLSVASEVRAHMKGLTNKQRLPFVHAAVERGDLRTVAAVLHAPPYLSGLSEAEHQTARQAAERKFAPLDSAQLDATERLIDQVTHAGSRVLERYARVLSLRDTPSAKARTKVAALANTGAR